MGKRCLVCRRSIAHPTSSPCGRLQRRRRAIERQIRRIEEGDLYQTIFHQSPAPSCTICEQAPPGKAGQPTDQPALVQELAHQLRELGSPSPGPRAGKRPGRG